MNNNEVINITLSENRNETIIPDWILYIKDHPILTTYEEQSKFCNGLNYNGKTIFNISPEYLFMIDEKFNGYNRKPILNMIGSIN